MFNCAERNIAIAILYIRLSICLSVCQSVCLSVQKTLIMSRNGWKISYSPSPVYEEWWCQQTYL